MILQLLCNYIVLEALRPAKKCLEASHQYFLRSVLRYSVLKVLCTRRHLLFWPPISALPHHLAKNCTVIRGVKPERRKWQVFCRLRPSGPKFLNYQCGKFTSISKFPVTVKACQCTFSSSTLPSTLHPCLSFSLDRWSLLSSFLYFRFPSNVRSFLLLSVLWRLVKCKTCVLSLPREVVL